MKFLDTPYHVFHNFLMGGTGVSRGIYLITSVVVGKGEIILSDSNIVNYNDSRIVTFIPDNGYTLSYFYIDNVYKEPKETYTFARVRMNHVVTAVYESNIIDEDERITTDGSVRISTHGNIRVRGE